MPIKKYLTVIILCFLSSTYSVNASVMESENYRLESDEIDMGAIGEMRDFPGFSQEKDLAGPIVLFPWKVFALEIILGSVGSLFFALAGYLVFKKYLFFK